MIARNTMDEWTKKMLRTVAFWCALVTVFFCGWGFVESCWVASFDARYHAVYVERAEVFFCLLLVSLLTALILAWKWIRLAPDRLISLARSKARS
jgi:hypothetical protein